MGIICEARTPTLTNIAFQRVFFSDSRVNYLEDQAVSYYKYLWNARFIEAAVTKIKRIKLSAKFESAFLKRFRLRE
jgi:cytochrome c peroxidase